MNFRIEVSCREKAVWKWEKLFPLSFTLEETIRKPPKGTKKHSTFAAARLPTFTRELDFSSKHTHTYRAYHSQREMVFWWVVTLHSDENFYEKVPQSTRLMIARFFINFLDFCDAYLLVKNPIVNCRKKQKKILFQRNSEIESPVAKITQLCNNAWFFDKSWSFGNSHLLRCHKKTIVTKRLWNLCFQTCFTSRSSRYHPHWQLFDWPKALSPVRRNCEVLSKYCFSKAKGIWLKATCRHRWTSPLWWLEVSSTLNRRTRLCRCVYFGVSFRYCWQQ